MMAMTTSSSISVKPDRDVSPGERTETSQTVFGNVNADLLHRGQQQADQDGDDGDDDE